MAKALAAEKPADLGAMTRLRGHRPRGLRGAHAPPMQTKRRHATNHQAERPGTQAGRTKKLFDSGESFLHNHDRDSFRLVITRPHGPTDPAGGVSFFYPGPLSSAKSATSKRASEGTATPGGPAVPRRADNLYRSSFQGLSGRNPAGRKDGSLCGHLPLNRHTLRNSAIDAYATTSYMNSRRCRAGASGRSQKPITCGPDVVSWLIGASP